MKALTIRQPWADAIAHGDKDIENRTWHTNYRGLIAIHAGAGFDPIGTLVIGRDRIASWPDTRGAIVAVAQLVGCHRCDTPCSRWAEPDTWHWLLRDVVTLPEPVPCKGRLGLWTPGEELASAVRAQMAEAAR